MSLNLNGLRSPSALLDSTGMTAGQLRANFDRHVERTAKRSDDDVPHPSLMGMGMVLAQREAPAYDGTADPRAVARRRARNKAARRTRSAARRARA